MKNLRIEVERVVRPLRASPRRKDRIREELLAHLTGLYGEELARTGDDKRAVSEAIRRFGDAPSLTHELQQGVSWLERWAFFSFPTFGRFRRRVGESPARYILRSGGYALVLSLVIYSLIALLCVILSNVRPHRIDQVATSRILLVLFGAAIIQSITFGAIGLLGERMRQELENRAAARARLLPSRPLHATTRIVFYSIVNSLVLGASIAALMLLLNACFPFPLISRAAFWWIIFGFSALGLPYSLLFSLSWQASARRFEDWESLDLNQQESA